MRKIIVMFSIIALVFTSVYVVPSKHIEAAILSKVATTGIKKAVKEVIKESAFDTAVNLFLDEAFTMALEERQKYQAQQDYELFCGKKMPDLITCEKPMQVKTNLTDIDKANIGQQAEIELDKLITGGKGFTRWQKFLDFILPIWLVSLSFTAITYALDPEVRSLFNEAGYNALVALGLIKPVSSSIETNPLENTNLPITSQDSGNTSTPNSYTLNTQQLNATSSISNTGLSGFTETNVNLLHNIIFRENYTDFNSLSPKLNGVTQFIIYGDTKKRVDLYHSVYGSDVSMVVYLNGNAIETPHSLATGITRVNLANTDVAITTEKINSVLHRTPYKIGGFYYTDVLYNTVDGNTVKFQIKSSAPNSPATITSSTWGMTWASSHIAPVSISMFKNQSPFKQILVPAYEEIEQELDVLKNSPYMDSDGQIAFVPPSSLPYTQTSTGLQLTPVIDETTGDKKFTTPTGENVPEDDITVGEPDIQYNPKPEPNTVTPPATQNNPNPEPIPLSPTSPPTSPPTTGEPPPPEDGGGGKPNIPLSLLLGLFKLLNAIIFYLIRMAAFIVTIQFIEPTVIPNPYFQWFTTAEILGIQPYPLVKNVALFFLSFSIYKSIRRVFP